METSEETKALHKVAACFVLNVLTLLIYANNAHTFEKRRLSDPITIRVESISHFGADEYKVEIVIMNSSTKIISVREFESKFYIQPARSWNMLELDAVVLYDSLNADPSLSANGKKMISTVLKIPMHTADIFRTYEGDVNIMFKYRLQYSTDRKGDILSKSNEEYYWISPGTDKWVHRECM